MFENYVQTGELISFINANILPRTFSGVKVNRKRYNLHYKRTYKYVKVDGYLPNTI